MHGTNAGRDATNVAGDYHVHAASINFGYSPRHQLPTRLDLTGREDELNELEALIREGAAGAAISGKHAGLQGMGGVGKTALAVELGHRLRDRWPDAQLVVELRGADKEKRPPLPPGEAMERIIHAFHPDMRLPEDAHALGCIYRGVLADAGAVLLLLDDAADAAQVEPLLPPENCLLIVTSRAHFDLPGVAARQLDCLLPEKSRELLLRHAARLDTLAAEAAELCGHLPLALRVFAGAVNDRTTFTPAELVGRLRERRLKLGKVEAAFEVSYGLLDEPMRRRWTLLAVFSANFDASAAAAVWEEEIDEARQALQTLFNGSLVEWNETTRRFRLHDLVRQFCLGKLSGQELDAARLRHARHFVDVADAANTLYQRGGDSMRQGLGLFDAERAHLDAAFAWLLSLADSASDGILISLVNAVVYTGNLRFHPRERIRWLEAQRDAARRAGQRKAEIDALGNLGNAYANLGEPRRAIEFYEQHRAIACEIGDRRGEGNDLGNLGNAYANLGEPRRAIEFYEQHRAIACEIGDRRGEGNALGNLGIAYKDLGEPRRAIEFYEQHRAIAREIGDRHGEGNALGNLGIAYKDLGEPRRAIEFYEQHRAIAREIGDRHGEGNALGNLGIAYKDLGEPRRAIEFYEQHRAIAREIGDRHGEGNVLGNLGLAYANLGEPSRAIEFYEQALIIDHEIGDRRGEGTDLWNSAREFWRTGQRDEAIVRAESALEIFEAIESPHANMVRRTLAKWRAESA